MRSLSTKPSALRGSVVLSRPWSLPPSAGARAAASVPLPLIVPRGPLAVGSVARLRARTWAAMAAAARACPRIWP